MTQTSLGVTSPFAHLNVQDSVGDTTPPTLSTLASTSVSNTQSVKGRRRIHQDDDIEAGASSGKKQRTGNTTGSQQHC